MHDIRIIRDDPAAFDRALARRGHEPVAEALVALDARRRELATAMQQAQARRNEASKLIGQAMAAKDQATADALKAEVATLKESLATLEEQSRVADAALDERLATLPNLPAEDVPDGADENDNQVKKEWWPSNRREWDFDPCEHADLAPELGMDFETGARLSGARFTFLRGGMARLHRALGQFMLDVQTGENGYTECNPPVLVKDEAMYGTDKLPKFAEDSFQTGRKTSQVWREHLAEDMAKSLLDKKVISLDQYQELKVSLAEDGNDLASQSSHSRLWLIPTSEVSLTASVMGELLDETALPIRLTALTLCFRSEAGAAGKDTRGFIRQHQFEKCELVSIVRPEDSEAEHERMTRAAETILEKLELPYRKLLLCTGDMGFGARKTYDLEVWLPGQGAWREISSCSNTGAFQARRMNTRYRVAGEKRTEFVHTLNGSGLAVGRTLVAVIENYQQADGSVTVPEALRPYMGGVSVITPP